MFSTHNPGQTSCAILSLGSNQSTKNNNPRGTSHISERKFLESRLSSFCDTPVRAARDALSTDLNAGSPIRLALTYSGNTPHLQNVMNLKSKSETIAKCINSYL